MIATFIVLILITFLVATDSEQKLTKTVELHDARIVPLPLA